MPLYSRFPRDLGDFSVELSMVPAGPGSYDILRDGKQVLSFRLDGSTISRLSFSGKLDEESVGFALASVSRLNPGLKAAIEFPRKSPRSC